MKNSPTIERVTSELLEAILTTEDKLALYGVARLIKAEPPEQRVPETPAEDAEWPVRNPELLGI